MQRIGIWPLDALDLASDLASSPAQLDVEVEAHVLHLEPLGATGRRINKVWQRSSRRRPGRSWNLEQDSWNLGQDSWNPEPLYGSHAVLGVSAQVCPRSFGAVVTAHWEVFWATWGHRPPPLALVRLAPVAGAAVEASANNATATAHS